MVGVLLAAFVSLWFRSCLPVGVAAASAPSPLNIPLFQRGYRVLRGAGTITTGGRFRRLLKLKQKMLRECDPLRAWGIQR